MRRIAIVGCRPVYPSQDPDARALYLRIIEDVCSFVSELDGSDITIVSGGAQGVDKAAEVMADGRLHSLIIYPDYDKHEKRAPLERNTLIVDEATEVHAWPAPWSRGTWDTIRKARAAGKPTTVHEVK